ncbi:heparin lyase I family protein [Candidatus Poribacteria bacterium]
MTNHSNATIFYPLLLLSLAVFGNASGDQQPALVNNQGNVAKSRTPVLASIDFESGSFGGVKLSGRNQLIAPNPSGQGNVFRAWVPNDSERSEIAFDRHLPGDYKWEGKTRWYAWRIYLPNDFNPSGKHTILAQWHRWQAGMHDRFSWAKGNPNVFAIDRNTKRYHISLSFQPDPKKQSRHAREKYVGHTPESIVYQNDLGRWIQWSALVRWSKGTDGSFILYRNGQPVISYDGPNYLNMPEGPYFKCGIYGRAFTRHSIF